MTGYLYRLGGYQYMIDYYSRKLIEDELIYAEYYAEMIERYKWELVVLDLLLELKMIEI